MYLLAFLTLDTSV